MFFRVCVCKCVAARRSVHVQSIKHTQFHSLYVLMPIEQVCIAYKLSLSLFCIACTVQLSEPMTGKTLP